MEELKQERWKKLSEKYLFREPWLTVRHNSYELPDGRVIPDYYILEYPEWVNTIAVTKDGKFVFVSQYRPGLDRTSFELCAGVSEKSDKSMEEAARRELMEETGYGGGVWQEFMTVSANASTTTNLTHCFIAEGVELCGERHLDDGEDIKVHLLTLDEVRELLLHDEIKQATHLAPLWKYFALKNL